MKIRLKGKFNKDLKRFPFCIVDIGARKGPKKEWGVLKEYLSFIGFEPEDNAYRELKKDENTTYFNSACYNKDAEITLHVTECEGLSSIFMPNYEFLSHFPRGNTDGYALKNRIKIKADRLDNLISADKREEIDFIKIDVEGAAFQVIQGAKEILSSGIVTGLLIEAEFNEKYKGQGLFAEVDSSLRKDGYELFDIDSCYWKRSAGTKTCGARGQLVHGDFLYFLGVKRFFEKIANLSKEKKAAKVIKFITFCCLYGHYDLALELLHDSGKRDILHGDRYSILEKELVRTTSIFMRIPKLKGRGLFFDLFYHLYMAICGIWLESAGFYKTGLEL